MAKISVADAAKKLKIEPAEFLKKLKEFGIFADDLLSTFDASSLERVKTLLATSDKPGVSKVEKRISVGVVRRRRRPKSKDAANQPEPVIIEGEEEFEELQEFEEDELDQEQEEMLPDQPEPVEAADPDQPETEVMAEIVQETSEPDTLPVSEETDAEVSEPDQPEEVSEAAGQIAVKPNETVAVAQAETPAVTTKTAKEEDKSAKGKEIPRKKGTKIKRIPIRGVTKEPARILSLPDKKIETLKLDVQIAPPPVLQDKPEDTSDYKKGKKGRKVVEVGSMPETRRHRKKEVFEKGLRSSRGKKKKRELKTTAITTPKAIKRKIKIMEEIQIGELAHRMGVKAGDLIKNLIAMGVMATINQVIDFDTAVLVAAEYGFEVENISVDEDDFFKIEQDQIEVHDMQSRPPVVTVMGHVDHGKTTLLDAIRKTSVAKGEAGGITQAIGAYNVRLEKGRVVFLDTPGHETFTAMRARGAQVTDIVVLIVAADDGVMPQTIEAIHHAQDAGVPIIVAINKIDKDNADIGRIRSALTEYGLVSEEWGGETLFAEISAKQDIGINELLETILLQAEIMEIKSPFNVPARGIILEAKLEKGRGPVANVLIKEGTLKVGDPIVCDKFWGRVRTMLDDKGRTVTVATPSMPIEVIGLNGVPHAGSAFNSTKEERVAKQVAELREKKEREKEQGRAGKISLEDLYTQIKEGQTKELKLIVKADVQGSVEAIKDAVEKLSNDEVRVKVIHSNAGGISETDVNFAIASNAIILGFSVRPEPKARLLAEREQVDIRLYDVIYDLVQDIEDALTGMLEPTYEEKVLGLVEVRNVFSISKIGTIAGCHVTEGKITRHARCRLIREGVVIYTGKIDSLKRFKDDAKEVLSGFECGIGLENYNDIKEGDRIETYEMVEVARKKK